MFPKTVQPAGWRLEVLKHQQLDHHHLSLKTNWEPLGSSLSSDLLFGYLVRCYSLSSRCLFVSIYVSILQKLPPTENLL